jgi:hypothetical protein
MGAGTLPQSKVEREDTGPGEASVLDEMVTVTTVAKDRGDVSGEWR